MRCIFTTDADDVTVEVRTEGREKILLTFSDISDPPLVLTSEEARLFANFLYESSRHIEAK